MFIVVETWPAEMSYVVQDGSGDFAAIFDTREEAEVFAAENCQRGKVVEIS